MSTERPTIDYANLPYLPREGIQAAGSNRYLTRSLFIETAPDDAKHEALWTMAEHEVWAYGRWFPSAWMTYIYATDEYDAIRKLVGNVRQWEHVKAMFAKVGRGHILEAWEAEQRLLQRSRIRAALEKTAVVPGAPGQTAAAKQLLAMLDGPKKRGRPAGEKPDEGKAKAVAALESVAARVIDFQR